MPPAAPRDVHVLITGYGPFGDTTHNPSYASAKPLNGTRITLHGGLLTIHITVIEIQVVYTDVLRIVPGLHATPPVLPEGAPEAQVPAGGYDFILHTGQGMDGHIALETLADQSGYNVPDVRGELAPFMSLPDGSGTVERGAGPAYVEFHKKLRTDINVKGLVAHLKLADQNVQQSFDPGRYLCGFIFYVSLAESKRKRAAAVAPSKVLFMHVPPPGMPHSLEEMTETLRKVVSWVTLNHIVNV